MTEEDVNVKITVENSIEFTLSQLNSKNHETILDTVSEIRNLIIGNNKYKTFYMHESLISRLASIVREHIKSESLTSSELINQIIIIFASFSLGNLENIIKLVQLYHLHEILFDLLKQNVSEVTNQNKLNIKLIESSLRCLSSLYTTCQLVPSLIYQMDKCLYSYTDESNEITCLDLLLKVYPMSNLTKRTVIQTVAISSTFLTNIFSSSNRYTNESVVSLRMSKKFTRMIKLNEQIKHRRSILIRSDCISKFAHLLTSLLEPIQLSVLKFYTSICFESLEALDLILTCVYYECSLLDLISAYLSRENSSELQLYAAKCLTNLCRSLQILNNSRNKCNSRKSSTKMTSSNYKFKKLIKNKIDECGGLKYEEADFDNEADYEEEDVDENNEEDFDNEDEGEEDENELNEHESELELDENDIEFETKTPPNSDEISMLNSECLRNDTDDALAFAKLESLYKHVDTSSQLIRRRVLPTLIRLCCTYSGNYRNSNMKNSNLSDFVSTNAAQYYYGLKQQSYIPPNKETDSQQYHLNLYLLIQSINTLTYLIELNADLQATASFLEQIVPTLSVNILEAYSIHDLDKIRLNKKNMNMNKKNMKSDSLLNTKCNKKRRLFQSLNLDNENMVVSSNNTDSLNKKEENSNEKDSPSDSSPPLLNESGKLASSNIKLKLISSDKAFSSLYSMFYLNYNQYAIKASQFKRNEHQYHKIANLNADILKNDEVFSESNKSNVKMLHRVYRYLNMLDKTVHKRLASSCFHALGALASNNEDIRRQITENSSLVCRLVDSIQLSSRHNNDNGDLGESEHEAEISDDLSKYPESEKTFKDAEDNGNIENIGNVLTHMKSDINNENLEMFIDFEENDNDDSINSLDEEFDDYNQTDSDLLRLSGLCLLHSLSRSVHQLRTKFLDKKIWMPIIDLIKRSRMRRLEKKLFVLKYKRLKLNQLENEKKQQLEANRKKLSENNVEMTVDEDIGQLSKNVVKTSEDDLEEVDFQDDEGEYFSEGDTLSEQNLLSVTTAILANLLLEFSPSKEIMEENGIIKILVELVDHKNHSIRVNCMWALMNTAFQADQLIKEQIISNITMEKLFQLLTEQDDTLIMKTLGLIRNLITNRVHIDKIMNQHGTKIIQAIIMILEGEYYNISIKEQALCILANVADGQTAKEFIMGNEDLLRKINSFMTYNSVELQIASVGAVSNLVWATDDGATERQAKMKEMGAHRILQKLLQHNDPILFDKVKNTLQQFASSSSSAVSAPVLPLA